MASEAQDGRTGPLAHLRVVDLTHMLAGPYCTWVLGSLGAEVIKVEMPGRGDFTRRIAPFLEGESLYFLSVNRNKRSITLNLKHEAGRAVLRRLVEKADVLVENNRPGAMARLGLDYAALSKINPGLIYASVSGFGQTGPYRERPAFDAIVQAMGGMMSITGSEEGRVARVGTSIGDIAASLFGAIGILAALADRAATGRGAHVDVAMLDSQVALLENAVARYLNAGDLARPIGTRHPLIAPFQAFPTKDHPIVICSDTQAQWQRLCAAIGRPDLVDDPAFVDGNARVRNHAKLEPALIAALATRTRAEWLAILEEADVPAGPVNDIAAVVSDPQVLARGMIAAAGAGSYAAQPVRLSSHKQQDDRAAPALGADTDAVLGELGYSTEAIARLREDGSV